MSSDSDTGDYGEVRYYITAGNIGDTTFILEEAGHLIVGTPLDFDTVPQHVLTIQAVDNQGLFRICCQGNMSLMRNICV